MTRYLRDEVSSRAQLQYADTIMSSDGGESWNNHDIDVRGKRRALLSSREVVGGLVTSTAPSATAKLTHPGALAGRAKRLREALSYFGQHTVGPRQLQSSNPSFFLFRGGELACSCSPDARPRKAITVLFLADFASAVPSADGVRPLTYKTRSPRRPRK